MRGLFQCLNAQSGTNAVSLPHVILNECVHHDGCVSTNHKNHKKITKKLLRQRATPTRGNTTNPRKISNEKVPSPVCLNYRRAKLQRLLSYLITKCGRNSEITRRRSGTCCRNCQALGGRNSELCKWNYIDLFLKHVNRDNRKRITCKEVLVPQK